jgi:hypothetical protein
MKLNLKSSWILLVILFLSAAASLGADPVVENVRFSQRTDGSKIIDVIYDVSDPDGDLLAVTLQVSDDGGATFDFPATNVSGDVGYNVAPGLDRAIEWDLGPQADFVESGEFQVRVVASDAGVLRRPNNRCIAITHFSVTDWSDPAIIEEFSRADFLQVQGWNLWQGGGYDDEPAVANLKALNPELTIIGYVPAFSAKLWGEPEGANPFMHDWFVRTRPYWVYTTEGDTAQTWPGNVVINILDPECRAAMVGTVVEYQRASLNKMDGVYWDYFNTQLWSYGVDMVGDPDMDGDGIGHYDDPDERAAFRQAQVQLVSALRDSLGEGFIQFFNGQRAYSDPAFASLADGLMYELFPTLYFPDPDMAHALDPEFQNSLFQARTWVRDINGGPFLVLANPWSNRYLDHNNQWTDISLGNVFRAVALITDTYSSWNDSGTTFDYSYGWPDQDISLGEALGPPVFEGDFIRRDFEYGKVELEWNDGAYPNSFDYRIWVLGQLVEELSIPFHYP